MSGGVNAPRGSALFETIVPVYICWFFTFIELCCVCVLLLPVHRKRKPAAKRRTKGAGQNGVWRHDGFHSSRFRAAKHDAETHAERLMFHYKVSLKMHGHFKVRAGDHSISLHDIVTGDHDQATKNMYAGALSDFMKCLLLTTPSAAAMEETLESTGLDPQGPLDAAQDRGVWQHAAGISRMTTRECTVAEANKRCWHKFYWRTAHTRWCFGHNTRPARNSLS